MRNEISKAIESALNGNSMLFLGAGFSKGAETLNGNKILGAKELAEALCNECGTDYPTDNLAEAADEFIDTTNDIDAAIDFLSTHLKCKSITPYHENVASVPWRCVFTTNYDNTYELACLTNGKNTKSVCLSDELKRIGAKEHLVVHLNGMIERLNKDSLFNEFKLTDSSYLTNEFQNSQWHDKFIREAEISESIIFVDIPFMT